MPIVPITLKGTKFLDELRKRVTSFRNAEIAARIQVPSDLVWWYWLEFGTATRQSSEAPVRGPGAIYPIDPIDRGDVSTLETLHWKEDGNDVFRKHVDHPGIRPHPFVRTQLNKILGFAASDVAAALLNSDNPMRASTVKATLMEETMPLALGILVESLAAAAPGTREDGKLDGNTAAEVFGEEAEIVDASAMSPGNKFTQAERGTTPTAKPKAAATPKTPKRRNLTWSEIAIRNMSARQRGIKSNAPKPEPVKSRMTQESRSRLRYMYSKERR